MEYEFKVIDTRPLDVTKMSKEGFIKYPYTLSKNMSVIYDRSRNPFNL